MKTSRGLLATLVAVAPAILLVIGFGGFLASCGDHAPPPAVVPPELAELSRNAENWATRGETLLMRPWASRLAFRTRLYTRVQSLRSFSQEAAAAANGPPEPHDRLIERGRTLVDKAAPFDAALALIELVTPTLDSLTGYDRMIDVHMPPLETRGEAPFRIRITDLQSQVKLGFTHLDEALTRTVEGAADAKTHENIATHNLRAALATATKLCEDVKQTSALASAATARQALLKSRIAWADLVVAKVGAAVPAEATQALTDARAYLDGPLPGETNAVLESLRNAQPDAPEKAAALAKGAGDVIERLTRAFLDLGRTSGVGEPK